MPYTTVDGSANGPLQERDNVHATYSGEPPTARTGYVVVSLFCIMVLSLLLGARFDRLRRSAMISRHITSMIVLLLNFLVFAFIFSSAIMVAGQGLFNHSLCFSVTWICLILYTACKIIIYVFLVERVHVVRAPFVHRHHDWLYWACMIMVITSFLGVAINACLQPIIEMQADGRCHMGIPVGVSIPIMVVDVCANIALTGVFVYLLRPIVKLYGLNTISGAFAGITRKEPHTQQARNETAVQRNVRVLLWKSLIGGILMMLATTANMVQLYITAGRELALICLTVCVLDISWDAVVIHWLTFGSVVAEKELTRSVHTPSSFRPKESQEAIMPQLREYRIDPSDEEHEASNAITAPRIPLKNVD